MKRSPIPRTNPARRKKRYDDAYGERGDFIRKLQCAVLNRAIKALEGNGCRPYIDEVRKAVADAGCWGFVEAAHTKTKAAGGSQDHLIPLCTGHHREQHTIGIQTFAAKYGLNMKELAWRYDAMWLTSQGLCVLCAGRLEGGKCTDPLCKGIPEVELA